MWISEKKYCDLLKKIDSLQTISEQDHRRYIEQKQINQNVGDKILLLEWCIKNPAKYVEKQKTKYGICNDISLNIIKEIPPYACYIKGTGLPKIHRQYTFTKGSIKTLITE